MLLCSFRGFIKNLWTVQFGHDAEVFSGPQGVAKYLSVCESFLYQNDMANLNFVEVHYAKLSAKISKLWALNFQNRSFDNTL
jgi:hypothetical protein